ncbi:alkane 1-monooxygenase [Sinimarinibacterium sp. CAU 1509]|uniref:alkane 1-monooxygenase n=1 Tax=Sinimarinibacterium sp. CAU 1509 TaxID=2562283 RepID=UPI0010AC6B4E|nr:alkane 1-monooxygenase [Sinimarinibacterium sp. CAU 1509]TJY59471.1 alkane 1-monooxygenase [Sinimarinibacterium sp. CAU 1509]
MPALIYPATAALALYMGGVWLWLPVALNLLLVPLADWTVSRVAPGWRANPKVLRHLFAPWTFWVYALAQAAVLLAVMRVAAGVTPLEFFALVSSTGIMTGTAGITAAHELVHRRDPAQRALGLALLAMTGYMHFRIEHVYGHHRNVATDADPSSAALGESFPTFFGRMLWRGPHDAWRIECARLQRRHLPRWSRHNRMLQYAVIQIGLLAAIAAVFGPLATLFFVSQCLMAVHLLEAVNYVQHYGLRRAMRDGRPEKVAEHHAWDASDPISALLVFNLSRHAGHHRNPALPAAVLVPAPGAPRLPLGFYSMVFLALVPPLWHTLMDPRVRALHAANRDAARLVEHDRPHLQQQGAI